MDKSYAGIGSRDTPKEVLRLMTSTAKILGRKGFTLRSGGAKGADSAFEYDSDLASGSKEIYLPWKGFEGSNSTLIVGDEKAFKIAEEFHPYWYNLKQGAQKLQARNSHQVLGLDLNSPADFILCHTKSGGRKGGTGQALRIAEAHNIPIFDFGCYANQKEMMNELALFLNKYR